jgi:hypothetical protein
MRISIAIVSLPPFDALAIEWLSLWCVYFHWLTDSVAAGASTGCWLLPLSLHLCRPLTSMPCALGTDWVPRVNRIQAIAPLMAQEKGVLFLKGCNSLKNWTKIVLLIMRTSMVKGTCLFIYTQSKSHSLCMGRTYTANRGNNNNSALNSLNIRGIARNGAKSVPARLFISLNS